MASDARDLLTAMPTGGDYGGASRATVEKLYRLQVLARTFDERAVQLNRQGRVGTYAPMAGHEAIQAAAAVALRERDWCFPTYRDHAIYMGRGYGPEAVLDHLLGRGNYVDGAENPTTLPPSIPVATQLPHAVGAGMAADYRNDDVAALVSFGDGATSEGDFHEAMNFAGVFEAPVVFLCQNNQYAISTTVERQTATDTLAEKAAAYGFDGVRVDGTDALAVKETLEEALEYAREGGGPTLVEAVTYRRGAHTTTDDPSTYRDESELEAWDDPVVRTRDYLVEHHDWSDEDDADLREWADERIDSAIETVESAPDPDPEEMFAHVQASRSVRRERQRRDLVDDPDPAR